jgi:hypothetical protein
MANPLEVGSVSPAPPNPDAGNALQQGAPQQQQAAPPPPTHAQTVAALRHFDAVKGELETLLKNPALGKSDVKSQVIDGVTKLVSERILSPAQAVIQLSQVPTDPIAQRKFIQQQMMQTVQAEHAIIAHHAAGFAGQGPEPTPSSDDHMDSMQALHANYGGQK